MQTLAFGLFEDRAAADAAITRLEGRELEDMLTIHEHEGVLDDEDIQGSGTRGWLFAVLGGLFAGLVTGVLAALVFGNEFGVGKLGIGLIAGLGAGAFGVLAAIAGTALPRRELARLQTEVAAGKTLVTVDAQNMRTSKELQAELERGGAVRTGVLSGPWFGSTRKLRPRATSSAGGRATARTDRRPG